jgi:hypothetical protein
VLRNTIVSSAYPGLRAKPYAANVLSVAVEVSVNPEILRALLIAGTEYVLASRRMRGVPDSVAPVAADLIANRIFYSPDSSSRSANAEKDETCLDILLDRIELLLKYQQLLRSTGTKPVCSVLSWFAVDDMCMWTFFPFVIHWRKTSFGFQ